METISTVGISISGKRGNMTKYQRCKAGAVKCAHKRNSDIGIPVCGMGEAPHDSYGTPCPFHGTIEVT
jgi:hypothetical protein